MNEDIVNLVEERIKNCEDTKQVAESRIISLRKQIEEAERDLFKAHNIKACLEGALKNLKDAQDREEDITAIRPVKEEEKPADYLGPLKKEEPSAMEKIIDDTEKEQKQDLTDDEILEQNKKALKDMAKGKLTPEERTKAALGDADRLIKSEEKREEQRKKGWKLCEKCNSNRVAPWNKKQICSECQNSSEGKRPYKRRKKEEDLPF